MPRAASVAAKIRRATSTAWQRRTLKFQEREDEELRWMDAGCAIAEERRLKSAQFCVIREARMRPLCAARACAGSHPCMGVDATVARLSAEPVSLRDGAEGPPGVAVERESSTGALASVQPELPHRCQGRKPAPHPVRKSLPPRSRLTDFPVATIGRDPLLSRGRGSATLCVTRTCGGLTT